MRRPLSIGFLACALAAQDNLLPSSGFEDLANDTPRGWARARWGGEGAHELTDVGRSGRGVAMRSERGADIAWSCTVPVAMQSRYRLAGWIRTESVATTRGGKGALLNVHDLQPVQTPAVTGTRDWTRVEVEFDTGFQDSVTINCLFGGWGFATGAAYYDDVELVLVRKGELPAPTIRIDAARVGAPISPYVYGQFIEHLGRCIQGGLWAEVIEDRKFFTPVGSDGSPWRSVGSRDGVSMRADGAFTGAHSVVIDPGGGIRQDLALRGKIAHQGHVWLAGDAAAAPVAIALAGAGVVTVRELTPAWTRHELEFPPQEAAATAPLSITARGRSAVRVGAISLMPADHEQGFRRDTLALLRELDAPVYRWPGGNFVSGYDWRDGVGERDRRPPRKNPAWQGIEPNDVGIDEFLALCALLPTEPYIAINTGLGDIDSAVAELQYCNGAPDTPEGARRAANGRSEPYGVRFWGIGNEMYGDWQLGHMPLADYVQRHNAFVDALRREDPAIVVIGVGAAGTWSETMLRECADRLDHLSEHVYWQERGSLLAHVRQAPDSLRRIAQAHRDYRARLPSLRGRDIRIVQDEWNYWYGPHHFGELGTRYFVKDALGVAAALHEFARHSDLFFMANYAQAVNVIGAIKTTPTTAWLETTGLVLKLYRAEFGALPVATECGPTLDAMAALSADRRTLTLGVVNPAREAIAVPLEIAGAELAASYSWHVLSGDPDAFNDADAPARIAVRTGHADGAPPKALRLEACSVTLWRFGVR
jgi:alpha-N-arabinofuranosidase